MHRRGASIRSLEHALTIDQIANMMDDVDIILTDGFKRAGKPAIEVVRAEEGLEIIGDSDQLLAIATDTHLDTLVPQLDINDLLAILQIIRTQLLR